MKYIQLIPVYALGLIFIFVSGIYFVMGMLHVPLPAISGLAGEYSGILLTTGFFTVLKLLELIIGIMILVKRTRNVGLILIAPIALNIFLYDLLIAQALGAGIFLVALNAIAIYQHRKAYLPMIQNA